MCSPTVSGSPSAGRATAASRRLVAPNKAAAKRAAADLAVPRLCTQCATAGDRDEGTWELSGELDGAPGVSTIEPA